MLLVVADATRTLVLLGLVALLVMDQASIELVVVAAFVLGVGETLRDTTAQTVVPRLVPSSLLERANGRLIAGEVAGNEFVGPLLGAALFAAGVAVPFLANSAVLALGALLVLTLRAALLSLRYPPSVPGRETVPSTIRAGVRWLARHRPLRALVVAGAFVALADSAWFAVFVLYTEVRLDLDALGLGMLLTIGAIGGLAGAFGAEHVIRERWHGLVVLWSMAVTGGAPALLLIAPELWSAVVVVIATSAAFGLFNVAATSLRQRLVPAQLLGRIIAVWRMAVLGAGALGALAGGAVAAAQGLNAPFVLSVIFGVHAVVVWWSATHRESRISS